MKKYSTAAGIQGYIEWTGKKSYWLQEADKVGDGRAEGRWGEISLTPDADGMHIPMFKSS